MNASIGTLLQSSPIKPTVAEESDYSIRLTEQDQPGELDEPNRRSTITVFRRTPPDAAATVFPSRRHFDARSAMWTASLCVLLLGLASCCVSLPQIQYVNDRPYHLKQFMECRGGKDMEINQVQDIDECKSVCVYRQCKALNLFQLGEFEFKCEILKYVDDIVPAQGAACYVTY